MCISGMLACLNKHCNGKACIHNGLHGDGTPPPQATPAKGFGLSLKGAFVLLAWAEVCVLLSTFSSNAYEI